MSDPAASPNDTASDTTRKNIGAIADIERDNRETRTPWQRVSRRAIGLLSSGLGMAVHVVLIGVWLVANAYANSPFDPYPFPILEIILSSEAIFLALLIISTQTSMQAESERRDHLDFQIQLLIETQTTKILAFLHTRLGAEAGHDQAVKDLIEETDIKAIHAAVKDELDR